MARKVLLASTDLFFSTKVRETARQLGVELVQVREDVANASGRELPDLVVVDLNADALLPVESIRAVRTAHPSIRIVAFVRHEEVELMEEARSAGALEVMARGAFSARLPAILAG